jgi:hypothetical protein
VQGLRWSGILRNRSPFTFSTFRSNVTYNTGRKVLHVCGGAARSKEKPFGVNNGWQSVAVLLLDILISTWVVEIRWSGQDHDWGDGFLGQQPHTMPIVRIGHNKDGRLTCDLI